MLAVRSLALVSLLALPAVTDLAPAQVQSTVFNASPTGAARAMEPWRRALAATADGALWCLVYDNDGSGLAVGQHLRLMRSVDSGASWAPVADTPTIGDGRGAVVAGADCSTLHVSWYANNGNAEMSLYYQAFDVTTLSWIGTPDLLILGTNANDQYYTADIEVTEGGTVGVSFHTHRAPLTSGMTAWSAGILVRRPGDPAFQGPFRCNTDTYGINPDLQAVGEVFHSAFRTNTGLYGIRYRAFDSATLQFTTPNDVPLYGASQSTMRASNTSGIAADPAGNLYVLFAVGAAGSPGSGEIRLGYAQAGNYGTWTSQLVAVDPDLVAGNVTYTHYGLARGEGGLVYAVYSKRTAEQHQNLYLMAFAAGAAVTPEITLLTTTETDSFTVVNGLRAGSAHTSVMVAVGGTPVSQAGGYVGFLAGSTVARAVRFGTSCSGSLPAVPRLYANTLPLGGTSYALGLDGLPPGAFFLLFVGGNCFLPPVSLDPFGLIGCRIHHDVWNNVGFIADAAGRATISLAIPANPWFANLPIHMGSLVLAPGANPGGAVTTNSVMSFFR